MDNSTMPGLLTGIAPEHGAAVAAAILLMPLLWLLPKVTDLLAVGGVTWAQRFRARRRSATPITKTTVCLLALAGTIHLALVPAHWQAEAATAVLFLCNGVLFELLAVAFIISTGWRRSAAVLLAATLIAYLGYIASGREVPDQVGLATALLELLALGLVLADSLPRPGPRRFHRRLLVTAGTLVGLTMLTGAVTWAASFRPGGDTGHLMPGMAFQTTAETASPQQQAAAAQLAAATRAGIAGYADVRLALAAGYRPSTPPLAATVHYLNPSFLRADRPLDPAHPAELVYANTRHGLLLLGAMFMTTKPGLFGPDVGGPLTRWHVHDTICFTPGAAIVGFMSPFGLCPAGSVNVKTPAMLHVWTIATPIGPFGELPNWYVLWLDQG